MLEAAFVFGKTGAVLHWHLPPDRSAAYLPDSADLWQVLWDNRLVLGGVAHTHPWSGHAGPSGTDLTTFAAVEVGLGQRLVWPVVTLSDIMYLTWVGPGRLDYAEMQSRRFRLNWVDIGELREMSTGG